MIPNRFPFLWIETTFRTYEERRPTGMIRKCLGYRSAARLVSEEQTPALGPFPQQYIKLHHLSQFRKRSPPALLGSFHQMGAQSVKVELVHDRPPGQHWLKPRNAEFARFLGNEVDSPLLDRRGAEPEVRHRFDRPSLRDAFQHDIALPHVAGDRCPLAGFSIEQQHGIADFHAHHGHQIMRGVPVQRYGRTLSQ